MTRARTNVERTLARKPRSWGHGSRAGHRTKRARQRTRRTGGPLALFILILIALGVSAERAQAQVSISSAANQTFTNGDPSTLFSTISITEQELPGARQIKANSDIRIHIPAGFHMSWDTGITTPTFTGSAVGKVSSTVSYPDDQTLLVDVLTNFSFGDQLIIDGLRFTNFSGASAANNLELETMNDGSVAATDDKTITILGVAAVIFATSPASLTEGNLAAATVTVDITDGTYDATLLTGDFTLLGAPTGTTIGGVTWDSGTRATLTLAFDETDFDADASLSVTVEQAALATGTGPATTGSVTVTAVVEVTASAATSTITASPTSVPGNGVSTATITVQLKDAGGNDLTVGGDAVALATTLGTLSAVTDNGDGSYSAGLTSIAGGRASVTGTVNGNPIADDAAVDFGVGKPAALLFTVQPSDVIAGGTIVPAVQVRVVDAEGNVVEASAGTVTLSIEDNPAGGGLDGTTSVVPTLGVAAFSDLSIDEPGAGYTLRATAGTLAAVSEAFDVLADEADLEVNLTVGTPVASPGDTIVYTLTVTNHGPQKATGVEIADELPSRVRFLSANASQGNVLDVTLVWRVGTLDVDASATLTITCGVKENDG